tara:strand:- start:13999 stop:14343 length:345 start_codon:yes stop_codon:yes gene_type:complete
MEEMEEQSQKDILDKLIKFVDDNSFIHPVTIKWFDLYSRILTNPKSIENNSNDGNIVVSYGNSRPKIPSIRFTGPLLIRLSVFKEHINHAYEIGKIREVDKYLRNLKDDQWVKF